MATATAVSDKQLELELQQELHKFETVQKKIEGDKEKLRAANTEKARLVAGVGHGTAKESEVVRVEEQIHAITIRLEGSAPILQQHSAHIDELRTEIHRRQAAAAKAAREKQFAELDGKMIARALRIREKLTQLSTEDLRELEELRGACMTDFPDLGGREVAARALEILFKPSLPSEALRNPEVHLAQLEAAGWVPFGYAAMDPSSTALQGSRYRVALASPLRFSIVSMRPKTPGS